MVCPYCNSNLELHEKAIANIYTLYTCSKMPSDGRIWCIPELHITINPKMRLI